MTQTARSIGRAYFQNVKIILKEDQTWMFADPKVQLSDLPIPGREEHFITKCRKFSFMPNSETLSLIDHTSRQNEEEYHFYFKNNKEIELFVERHYDDGHKGDINGFWDDKDECDMDDEASSETYGQKISSWFSDLWFDIRSKGILTRLASYWITKRYNDNTAHELKKEREIKFGDIIVKESADIHQPVFHLAYRLDFVLYSERIICSLHPTGDANSDFIESEDISRLETWIRTMAPILRDCIFIEDVPLSDKLAKFDGLENIHPENG